jgi:hypothetical protein
MNNTRIPPLHFRTSWLAAGDYAARLKAS